MSSESEQGGTSAGSVFSRVRHMRVPVTLSIVVACATLIVAACTEVVQPTSTPVVFEPTPAPAGTRAQVLAGADPLTLAMLAQPRELPSGTATAGEALYTGLGCTACHTLTDETLVGPGFSGIYARAGTRTDMSADDYIVESLTRPAAFVVDGFTNTMQVFDYLSDQEIADIIAFLKTVD